MITGPGIQVVQPFKFRTIHNLEGERGYDTENGKFPGKMRKSSQKRTIFSDRKNSVKINGRFCRLNIPPGHIWTIQIPDSSGIQMIAVLQNVPGQCRFDG